MAFFKKGLSDEDFKKQLETEALEKKEAGFIEELEDNSKGAKKAPMVITPEELLGVEQKVDKKPKINTEDISMQKSTTSTKDFLYKKMMESREEATAKATENKGTLFERTKDYTKEAVEETPPSYFELESVEDILKRMEQKATQKVNSLYGITSPEVKSEPKINEDTPSGFNIEDVITEIEQKATNKLSTDDSFEKPVKIEAVPVIENIIPEQPKVDDLKPNVLDNTNNNNVIEEFDEFVDAEDIVMEKDELYKKDVEFEENFKTNIFSKIEETKEPQDIFSGVEIEDEPEEITEHPLEYRSFDDYKRTLKYIKRGKISSLLSILFALASMIFGMLGEVIFKDGSTTFCMTSAILLSVACVCNTNILKSFGKIFVGKINPDFAVSTISIIGAIYNLIAVFNTNLNLGTLCLATSMPILFVEIIRQGNYTKAVKDLKAIAAKEEKNVLVFCQDNDVLRETANLAEYEEANICLRKKAKNVVGLLTNEYCKNEHSYLVAIVTLLGLAFSIISSVAAMYSGEISPIFSFMATLVLAAMPAGFMISNLPLKLASNRLKFYGASIFGESSVNTLDLTNNVVVNVDDIFPEGTVKLMDFKLLSPNPIDQTLLDAAALTHTAKSPLAGIFRQITDMTVDQKELPVDTVVYEERMGISGWVDDRRVFVGNRTLMEAHGFKVPSLDIDKKILKRGYFPVYLGSENVLCALLIVKYTANPEIALELRRLASTGTSILVNNCDQNVTSEMIEDYLGLYEDSVYISSKKMQKAFKETSKVEDSVKGCAVAGEGICGLIATITAAIKIKKLNKIMSIIYVVLTICALAGLTATIFMGNYALLNSSAISAMIVAVSLICALPPYITRP